MARIRSTLLFWTLILCACASVSPASQAAPRIASITPQPPTHIVVATTPASPGSQVPEISITPETPQAGQPAEIVTTVPPSNPQDCAYQWAYQDLPQLSSEFLQSIQSLQAEAQANAFAFGENCIHADGSATFLAKETDFNVTLQVADLSNEADLGDWIMKVMQVVQDIPADQIVGPGPGRIRMIFQSGGNQTGINFYVDQYRSLPSVLSNAEILQALKTTQ